MNRRRHVLTEETLGLYEIGERLEHTPQKSLNRLSQESGVVCTKTNKITEITYTYCEYAHFHTMTILV